MHRLLSIFALAVAAASTLAAEAPLAVTLSTDPATAYVEHMPDAQHLNFDLLVKNGSDVAVDIDRIELSVLDREGNLLLQRFVDGNGVRPSIATIGERHIEAGVTLMLFNPFHTLANELELGTLRFQFELSNADGSRSTKQSLDIKPVAYRNHADYILPIGGRVLNYDGHDALGHHRRFDVHFAPIAAMGFKRNAMRYSYDFVPVDASGAMRKGEFADNASWFGFGDPIRAIGDGVVVAVENAQADDRKFDQSKLAENRMVLFGNYVVVDHGHQEFGVYAHAQSGSVAVKVGDKVKRGQSIAKIGASGSAFFPHLHFQLQNGPDMDAEALPSYFNKFSRVLGSKRIARKQASVDTGEIVEAEIVEAD